MVVFAPAVVIFMMCQFYMGLPNELAGATLTTLPLVLIFFFSQRYFLEGIKMTGLKG